MNRDTGRGEQGKKGKNPPSGRGYKCEDVLDSGRNPNGIGSGNRSGGTRIGVRLVERGVTCGMMLGHMGTSSGFPGLELLFAYTQSTPTFTFLPLCFFVSFFSCACIHTHVFTHSNACLLRILINQTHRDSCRFFQIDDDQLSLPVFFLRFHVFGLIGDYWYTVTVISQVHACG